MIEARSFHALELTASLLGLVATLLVVLIFALMPRSRGQPSEIVFFVAAVDALLALKFVIRASAWLVNPEPTKTSHSMHVINDGCVTSIAWSACFETACLAYNAVWSFHMAYQLKRPHDNPARLLKFYHVYAAICVILMVALQLGASDYGEVSSGVYSFCTLKPSSMKNPVRIYNYVYSMLQLVIVAGSTIYVAKRLWGSPAYNTRLLLYFQTAYALLFLIIWGAESVAYLPDRFSPPLHQAIGLLWLAQGFFVAIVRLSEPGLLALATYHFLVRCQACCCPSPAKRVRSDSESMHSVVSEEDAETMPARRGSLNAPLLSPARVVFETWGVSPIVRSELEITDTFGPVRSSTVTSPQRYQPPQQTTEIHGDL